MKEKPSKRSQLELDAFRNNCMPAYYEGNPLDPIARSSFVEGGYMSVLYACYIMLIKPYVDKSTNVLEIGSGKGAWTKCFLEQDAKEIYCVDAISAEDNQFWDYVGHDKRITYLQIKDISLSELPDKYFDYFYSFGVFCHISPSVVKEYLAYMYKKLKPGANGFFLYADYVKYNHFIDNAEYFNVARALFDCFGTDAISNKEKFRATLDRHYKKDLNEDDNIDPTRFYHLGEKQAGNMLTELGYDVVSIDTHVLHRDPIVHFKKPAKQKFWNIWHKSTR